MSRLFSNAIGYIQNFENEKDGMSYSMSISSNYGTYEFSAKLDEMYKGVDIHSHHYDGKQGLVCSYEVITYIDEYFYVVSCDVNKDVFEKKEIAVEKAKEIAYVFMYQLIDQ